MKQKSLRLLGVIFGLHFFDLEEVEFERGFAAEHGDHDFDLSAGHVHVVHLSLLALERTVGDGYE